MYLAHITKIEREEDKYTSVLSPSMHQVNRECMCGLQRRTGPVVQEGSW